MWITTFLYHKPVIRISLIQFGVLYCYLITYCLPSCEQPDLAVPKLRLLILRVVSRQYQANNRHNDKRRYPQKTRRKSLSSPQSPCESTWAALPSWRQAGAPSAPGTPWWWPIITAASATRYIWLYFTSLYNQIHSEL